MYRSSDQRAWNLSDSGAMRNHCAAVSVMDVSVLIATHRRLGKIERCVRALSGQTLSHDRFEVLVGSDGPEPRLTATVRRAWPDGPVRAFECERGGQASVRNQLLPHAKGRLLVFLNDDMIPESGLLEGHLAAQHRAARACVPALVVGDSPWVVHEDDTVIDRMIRETSMIFFYHRMKGSDPDYDWGFRHAWLLNLSCASGLMWAAGGLTVFPCSYGYEDDEFAYRAVKAFGARVLYAEQATARHDHRIPARSYLEREYRLGYAAFGFAARTPECARAMFRRDVLSEEEVSRSRERAAMAAHLLPILDWFLSLDSRAGAEVTQQDIAAFYERHLPLKRWAWHVGFVEAIDGRPMDAASFLARQLAALVRGSFSTRCA